MLTPPAHGSLTDTPIPALPPNRLYRVYQPVYARTDGMSLDLILKSGDFLLRVDLRVLAEQVSKGIVTIRNAIAELELLTVRYRHNPQLTVAYSFPPDGFEPGTGRHLHLTPQSEQEERWNVYEDLPTPITAVSVPVQKTGFRDLPHGVPLVVTDEDYEIFSGDAELPHNGWAPIPGGTDLNKFTSWPGICCRTGTLVRGEVIIVTPIGKPWFRVHRVAVPEAPLMVCMSEERTVLPLSVAVAAAR